jgi:hypothetical protein
LREATLEEGHVGPPGGHEVWRLAGQMPLPGGPLAFDQRLSRYEDGVFALHAEEAALRVDAVAGVLTVEAPTESWSRQLVTTYGIPLLLREAPAVVLHACAVVAPNGDDADVICAASGTGKSTLLVALIGAGWRAVSEDISVVDLRGPAPSVWPGPPWVRREVEGPAGSAVRFRTADKTAWDIGPWQVDGPVPVRRVVFMEPAGTPAVWKRLDRGTAVGRLATSTVWLEDPPRRAAATFDRCVGLAGGVAAAELRVPVSDDWVEHAAAALLG